MKEPIDPAAAVAALQALLAQASVATDPDAGLLRPGEARALLRDVLRYPDIEDATLQSSFERLRDGWRGLGIQRRGRLSMIPLTEWRSVLDVVGYFASAGTRWESAIDAAMDGAALKQEQEREEAQERRPIRRSFGDVS